MRNGWAEKVQPLPRSQHVFFHKHAPLPFHLAIASSRLSATATPVFPAAAPRGRRLRGRPVPLRLPRLPLSLPRFPEPNASPAPPPAASAALVRCCCCSSRTLKALHTVSAVTDPSNRAFVSFLTAVYAPPPPCTHVVRP